MSRVRETIYGLELSPMLAINQAVIQRKGEEPFFGPRYLAISEYWRSESVRPFKLNCQYVIGAIMVQASNGEREQLMYVSQDQTTKRGVASTRLGYEHESPWEIALTNASKVGLGLSGLDLVDYGMHTTNDQMESAHRARLDLLTVTYAEPRNRMLQDFYDLSHRAASAASQNGADLTIG